jgi:DNA-binding response OmpR family regulator
MYKVLLADDSLTIQKVIKITLANEPFQIINCKTEADLFSKFSSEKPHLVFLDFSLSDDRNGYELCAEIVKKNPSVAVLMLYGTFDTIDEGKLSACGASDKIVKPFDSSKFIAVCKKLTEKLDQGVESSAAGSGDELKDNDSWTIDEEKEMSTNDVITSEESASIEEQLEDWGVSVPGVIVNENENQLESLGAIPGVIGGDLDEEDEPTLEPSDEDLEYPDMGEVSSEPSSKLVPLEEMNEVQETSSDADLVDGGTETDIDIQNILGQIKDEVDSDDLWSVDEYEVADADEITGTKGSEINVQEEVSPALEAKSERTELPKEEIIPESIELEGGLELVGDDTIETFEEEPALVESTPSLSSVDFDSPEIQKIIDQKVEALLQERLEDFVKKAVHEYCEKSVESIAWEVIPDLAENNIKNEIKKISDTILNQE